jgi:glycosyltransferase 2 family protein
VKLSPLTKLAIQALVSGGLILFLVWRIDVGRTLDLIAETNVVYLLGAFVLFFSTTWMMAWRWQVLLASKGIQEPLGWLTKLYFIAYAAGQVLPTLIGSDAVRIATHSRRRPNALGEIAGAVLMERVLGAAGTLVMVAGGLALALGRYNDIGELVLLEIVFTAGMIVAFTLLFSRRANAWLQARGGDRRLARIFRSLWLALHGYREKPRVLFLVLAATVGLQFIRILSIWLCGEAVGLDLSPVVYIVMGPLLFLVMLVPFTINGLGVREAFFIAFLTRFDVPADAAFATGFLFYAITLASALPGAFILLWRSVRPASTSVARPTPPSYPPGD